MKKTILPTNLFAPTTGIKAEIDSGQSKPEIEQKSESPKIALRAKTDEGEKEKREKKEPRQDIKLSDKSFLLRLPGGLHKRISDLAWKDRISLHAWILDALAAKAEKKEGRQ
jgi:predicted HicB family RNase H-like nuclease